MKIYLQFFPLLDLYLLLLQRFSCLDLVLLSPLRYLQIDRLQLLPSFFADLKSKMIVKTNNNLILLFVITFTTLFPHG